MAGYKSISAESSLRKNDVWKKTNNFCIQMVLLGLLMIGFLSLSFAAGAADFKVPSGPKWAIDETKWMTVGMGFRGSGIWAQNKATDSYNDSFSIDNARVYLNGQIHQYVKFEVNTECFFCNNTSSMDNPKMSYNILDAIGKVEINRYVNIWGGRMLVPTERGELSGPFFQATHDAFKTPFFPQDFRAATAQAAMAVTTAAPSGAASNRASSRVRWAMQWACTGGCSHPRRSDPTRGMM